MPITFSRTHTVTFLEIEDGPYDWTDYERQGPRSWTVRMGESWEPIYDAHTLQRLEALYQVNKHRIQVVE